jgi:murein DD-endopeptidase MepM/ murein hydrolase activator NlpD
MASDDLTITAPQTTPTGAVNDSGKADAQRQQVKRLAEEFEAMLTSQMLREMRRSMVSSEEGGGFGGSGFGADVMNDTVDVELGRALSRVGGFGLSGVLLKAIERQVGVGNAKATKPAEGAQGLEGPATAATTAPAPSMVTPSDSTVAPPSNGPAVTAPDPAPIHTPASWPISSGYGWRRDPINGMAAFHSGVDVALAYGTDVQAAAEGRVAFAGANGGYGNMVVVEHSGGRQTRYAHLSAINVQAGDVVQSGDVIGRVGSTGHSTGPHLHFEIVDNGHAVDPFARSKEEPASAD